MNITADTNVLARALVGDDPAQAAEATRVLREASTIAIPLPVLSELVWHCWRPVEISPMGDRPSGAMAGRGGLRFV